MLKYLARYTHRVAISDRRIVTIQDAGVTFRYRDNTRGQQVMTLDGVEFLRRFLLHVLPTGFVRIRYFGLFANRHRTSNLARCRQLLAAATAEPTPPTTNVLATPAPAKDEPYPCPVCSTGRLVRVGTITPESELGLAAWAPVARDTS
jgi:Putative transposase